MSGIEEVSKITDNSRELYGGNQANYFLELKVLSNNGDYYIDTPNKPIKIDGTGTNVVFPDGRTYIVDKIDSNGMITYRDPRTNGAPITKSVAQAQEDFRQFELVGNDQVRFRGKIYNLGDTIPNSATASAADPSIKALDRDIVLVKADNGDLVYKTTWDAGIFSGYHEDQYAKDKTNVPDGTDPHEFRLRATPADPATLSDSSNGSDSGAAASDTNAQTAEQNKSGEGINEWTSRSDKYEESKYLKDDYDHSHDDKYMSKDIGKVGEIDGKKEDDAAVDFETYFHDEGVQKKFNELYGGSTIHKGEGISHHHHQTMTDSYEYNGKNVTYLPGQLIELAGGDAAKVASVEPFTQMYTKNVGKNILGETIKLNNEKPISRIEYAAVLASSGKYSMQDLFGTADALTDKQNVRFGKYEGPFFKGTKFEELLNDKRDYESYAKEVQDDITALFKSYEEIHENITTLMSGEAVDAAKFDTLNCILEFVELGMGNLNDRMYPEIYSFCMLRDDPSKILSDPKKAQYLPPNPPKALTGVPDVKENTSLLDQLRLGEKYLESLKGEGEDKVEPNLKDLEKAIEEKREEVKRLQSAYDNITVPSLIQTTAADGTARSDNSEERERQSRSKGRALELLTAARDELKKLLEEREKLKEQIDNLTKELNAIMEYSMILLDSINKYDTFRGTYKKYVLPGQVDGKNSDIYNWLTSKDVEVLVNNHDAIVHAFEDYDSMPVITNKSDFVKDEVLYEGAHGFKYVVKGYDPITGELIIVCLDKDGNEVGNPIRVWDQREITPVHQDIFEKEYPSPTIPETTAPNKPTPPGPKPTPTRPDPTPTPTKPEPTPTLPPAPTPTLPPEPTPTVPMYTTPPPPPAPTPTPPPYGPHTGLDAIYGAGETKQSATGLGALAGLAAGAAGLGLTGLIGDRKDEDEEEEEEKDFQMAEESKPLEHDEKDENQETTREDDFSDPQFF